MLRNKVDHESHLLLLKKMMKAVQCTTSNGTAFDIALLKSVILRSPPATVAGACTMSITQTVN